MNFIKKCIMYFVVTYLCMGLQHIQGMRIESWILKKALEMEHKLYSACEKGEIATVREILKDKQVDVNKVYEINQTTSLYVACQNKYEEIVKMLLAHNDIDVNKGERAPLYAACQNGREEIVKMLLAHNDIDVNKGKQVPLYAACQNGHEEIVKMLLERNDIKVNKKAFNPLRAACSNGHEGVVKMLLGHKNIDLKKYGCISLCDACEKENEKIVEILLTCKNIDINGEIYTPLYCACNKKNEKIVKMLLKCKDIDINKGSSKTPLYVACKNRHKGIVQILLAHSDIDVNKGEYPPLYGACLVGDEAIIKMLLACKDVNIYTILNFFVEQKFEQSFFKTGTYKKVLAMLLENGLFNFFPETDFDETMHDHFGYRHIASILFFKIKMLQDLQDKYASCFLTLQVIKDYFCELTKRDMHKECMDSLDISFKTPLSDDSRLDLDIVYDLYIQGTFSGYIRAFLKNKILSSRQMKLCEIYMKETKQQGGAQKKLYDCCQENMEKLFKKYPYFKEWFAQMLVEYQRSQKLSKTRDVACIRERNKNMAPDVKICVHQY